MKNIRNMYFLDHINFEMVRMVIDRSFETRQKIELKRILYKNQLLKYNEYKIIKKTIEEDAENKM